MKDIDQITKSHTDFILSLVEFVFTSAFKHGYKHGLEEDFTDGYAQGHAHGTAEANRLSGSRIKMPENKTSSST